MKRYLFMFAAVALGLYTLVYLPPVRSHLIGPFTFAITWISGWLIQAFGGTVTISGNQLAIPGFAVEVLDMCNGVEATLLLWAALLAYPAPWRHKLLGLLAGTFAVHSVNRVRIISLLYLGAYDQDIFHWVHWYLWDALIMLDILAVFLLWIRWMPSGQAHRGLVAA